MCRVRLLLLAFGRETLFDTTFLANNDVSIGLRLEATQVIRTDFRPCLAAWIHAGEFLFYMFVRLT